MNLKIALFITLALILSLGGIFSVKITHAQGPPPATHVFLFPRPTDYRIIRVNVSWTEKGVTKSKDYYSVVRDLSVK